MSTTSLRTQIILPRQLRAEIDKQRRVTGESMAEYLRKAAMERSARQKMGEERVKWLLNVIGKRRKSGWDGLDVVKWQKEMRRDRK